MNDEAARHGRPDNTDHLARTIAPPGDIARSRRPPAAELLDTPGALLSRSDLRALGLERRAVDAVFRALPVIALPGYSRPLIRAADYRRLLETCIYAGDRVRPAARSAS